jgi:hypothetical protein
MIERTCMIFYTLLVHVYRYVHKNLNVDMIRSFLNNEHASCKRHFNPEHILMLV